MMFICSLQGHFQAAKANQLAPTSRSTDARAARLATPQAAADGQSQTQVGAAEEDATPGEVWAPQGGDPRRYQEIWRWGQGRMGIMWF